MSIKVSILVNTQLIKFIYKIDILKGKIDVYMWIVVNIYPFKKIPERLQFSIRYDQIDFFGETTTRMVDLTTYSNHFNRIVSTKYAQIAAIDRNNFIW